VGGRVEVVQDPHAVARFEQQVDHVGADESGAAGDECLQCG
jgi:hypothetical protein